MSTRIKGITFALLLPFLAMAQCAATFTYQVNGNTVTFDATVTPPPTPNASFYWWFDDNGNSSNMMDPVYTFSGPGTYTVCFSFYDPVTSCGDSICQNITITSTGGCSADFTWLDTMGYTYFISSTTAPGAIYYWSFGDGNYSTQQNPSNTYWNPGTYTACLTVYDSNMVFCDSTCHTITVQGSGGCNADFTWIDSLGYVFFVSSSTVGNSGYYLWDFGDGNYSNTQNPSHQYVTVGQYIVCLTVLDSMQNFCDSVCYTIFVQSVGVEDVVSLQNSFSASPIPADESIGLYFTASNTGVANISFYDASGRMAYNESVVHSAGYVNAQISTTNMSQGIYLVKLELDGAVAWKRIALTHQ